MIRGAGLVVAMASLCSLAGCQLVTRTSAGTSSAGTSSTGPAPAATNDRASGASTGTTATVPDVTGMSKVDAEAAIQAAGIQGGMKIGNEAGSYDPATAKVCTQVPGGGQQTSSTLFVSIRFCHVDGPQKQYPQVVGLSPADATKLAKSSGFEGTIEVHPLPEFDPSCKPDIVCGVYPERWYFGHERSMTLYINRKVTISVPD